MSNDHLLSEEDREAIKQNLTFYLSREPSQWIRRPKGSAAYNRVPAKLMQSQVSDSFNATVTTTFTKSPSCSKSNCMLRSRPMTSETRNIRSKRLRPHFALTAESELSYSLEFLKSS